MQKRPDNLNLKSQSSQIMIRNKEDFFNSAIN